MPDAVRQRLDEIREKQLESQSNTRTSRDLGVTKDKALYQLAIGGVAAGFIIAVIAWLTWSLVTVDQGSNGIAGTQGSIHTNMISEANRSARAFDHRLG